MANATVQFNKEIHALVNGIISHGNHSHTEYSFDEFQTMYILFKLYDGIDNEEQDVEFDVYDAEIVELYDELESNRGDTDFTIDFDGNEYRIIADSAIWGIYVEEIKNVVNNCYDLKLDKMPEFIAFDIDWEKTAENCYIDGYGHTFASYDGEESEVANYWIFRTN